MWGKAQFTFATVGWQRCALVEVEPALFSPGTDSIMRDPGNCLAGRPGNSSTKQVMK
jgi:hypothetical protein